MQLPIKKMRWFGAINIVYSIIAIIASFLFTMFMLTVGSLTTTLYTLGKIEITGERLKILLNNLIHINQQFILIGVFYLVFSFLIKKYKKAVLVISMGLLIYSIYLFYQYAFAISFYDNLTEIRKSIFWIYGTITGYGILFILVFFILLAQFFLIHIFGQIKHCITLYKSIQHEKVANSNRIDIDM